jgi:hypothetical protein
MNLELDKRLKFCKTNHSKRKNNEDSDFDVSILVTIKNKELPVE